MPDPDSLRFITVRGRYMTPDGTPAEGTVSFAPTLWLRDDVGDNVIPQARALVHLDDAGELEVLLVATDSPGIEQDWAYQVTEAVDVRSTTRMVQLPSTLQAVDMSDLPMLQVEDEAAYVSVVGPTGPTGPSGTVDLYESSTEPANVARGAVWLVVEPLEAP